MSPESPALTVDDARDRIARAIAPIVSCESIALEHALGRVLAVDCIAASDVPPHANAAMDGYALSVATAGAREARVVGSALAGHPYGGIVATGDCVRITTGALVPDGCDVVVPHEQVDPTTDGIALRVAVRAGQHIRSAGEDLRRGATAIARGRRLRPADLGVAASLGLARLDVLRRPRVAVFSTGDELVAPGEPRVGALYDSNRYSLIGLLARSGAEVVDLGIVPDDPARLAAALDAACIATPAIDAILTSGGVSAGDADHTRGAFAARGHVDFWKVAIKPGRPVAFGTLRGGHGPILFFGLPGNPVAVMVAFEVFARDALWALSGASPEPRWTVVARAGERIAKQPGRSEFLRGVATRGSEGWTVHAAGDQGSGQLRSMSEANCLIALDHTRGDVAVGDLVDAWPLNGTA